MLQNKNTLAYLAYAGSRTHSTIKRACVSYNEYPDPLAYLAYARSRTLSTIMRACISYSVHANIPLQAPDQEPACALLTEWIQDVQSNYEDLCIL